MKNLWVLKREFLEYCEIEKGQSVLTIDNYGRYLDRFLTWLEGYKYGHNNLDNDLPLEDNFEPFVKRAKPDGTKQDTKEIKGHQLSTEDITEDSIRQYRLYVNRLNGSDGKELKTSTQNHHVLSLRAFLRYLLSRGIQVVPPEKLSLAKTGEREISFMNQEEYMRLLQAPNVSDLEGLRDRVILEILFSTGMRVSELASCNIGQINFEQGEIAILGKGKKLRVVFLSDTAIDYLIKYLKARGAVKTKIISNIQYPISNEDSKIKDQRSKTNNNEYHSERSDNGVEKSHYRVSDSINNTVDSSVPQNDTKHGHCALPASRQSNPESCIPSNNEFSIIEQYKNDPLFLSSRGNRMNVRGIERIVKKYSLIAGISKNISPHSLRHTFATDLLSAGADIRSVQSMLGHSNLSTTQIYTHVTDQHLREVHRKFHGKSSNDTEFDTE